MVGRRSAIRLRMKIFQAHGVVVSNERQRRWWGSHARRQSDADARATSARNFIGHILNNALPREGKTPVRLHPPATEPIGGSAEQG